MALPSVPLQLRYRFVAAVSFVFACAIFTMVAAENLNIPEAVFPLHANTAHVQGIAVESGRLWVSSVDRSAKKGMLYEFALPGGKLRHSVEVQGGDRYHPGGISVDSTSLWTPVAEYRRSSTTVIQKRSKQTLAIEAEFKVADHIGCLAVTPSELIGGNWDTRELYIWTHAGKLIRKVANPTNNAFQDMKFEGGRLIGSGLLPDKSGAIDWIEYPDMRPVRRIQVGRTDRGVAFTHEGMAISGDQLWLLPEDAPSRLFMFRLKVR